MSWPFCKQTEIKELGKDTVTVSYFTINGVLAPSTEILCAVSSLDKTIAPVKTDEKYK